MDIYALKARYHVYPETPENAATVLALGVDSSDDAIYHEGLNVLVNTDSGLIDGVVDDDTLASQYEIVPE